jgi:Flp pilus assembly protein TadG
MIAHRILRSLSFRCRRFAADRRGVSAVEFALLLPLMLTMYFGSIQITDGISADRQVTLVASTVAEIASQYSSVAPSDLTNILNAAANVFTPFPMQNGSTTVGTITLTSVTVDATGKATVDWSKSLNGTQRSVGAVVTSSIPSGLLNATPGVASSLIWGEATYSYKPVVGWVVTGTVPMYDQIFLRPRQSSSICLQGTNC